MSISKNFVVRHGFEVSTDLILADADTRKVGIASTNPQFTLDVAGGIGATDFYLTGIGTFVDELNVGLGGTVLTVLGIGNSIGIGTALPQYLLDIRSPVSTGQTALYVQGDVRITGDINADDVVFDDAQIQDLTVTDTLIVAGLSTFNSNVFINAALNVSGVTTLGSYVDINDSVDIADDLNVVGLSTLGGYVDINDSLDVGVDLNVVGLSTLGGYVDINDSVDISNDLNVVGVTTLATADINAGEIDVTRIETGNLNVSGIATIATISVVGAALSSLTVSGIGTITNLNSTNANLTNIFSTNLSVAGIATLGTVEINAGIITASSGIVTYFGDGSGLINTPPGNPAGSINQVQYNDGVSFAGSPNFTFDGNNVNVVGIITALEFYGDGSNLTGIATGGGDVILGITTITELNVTGITTLTSLEVTGVSTFGNIVLDPVGIITAVSGIVTYYGDGSNLIGVGIGSTGSIDTVGIITASAFFGDGSGLTGAGSTVFNDITTDQEFFPLFTDITTGTITASGISTSKLTYNPSTGTLTAVDLNSTSDINLKENIKTIENSLNTLTQLRGVSFDWKETGKSSYGVIAQELEEILPELVKNGEVKSVNYNGLIGVLIEAVKELSEEVKELKKYK
jgi:hypothetical protein